MTMNLMMISVKKVFISSNSKIICLPCPLPRGRFLIQESAVGGLSYYSTKNLEPFFHKRIGDEIRVVTSADHWIDFIAPNANKGTALKVLMEKFGIKKEECICFGDQQNDIEMLKAAGTAYVMATGHPLAKKAADYVVESPLPVIQGLL